MELARTRHHRLGLGLLDLDVAVLVLELPYPVYFLKQLLLRESPVYKFGVVETRPFAFSVEPVLCVGALFVLSPHYLIPASSFFMLASWSLSRPSFTPSSYIDCASLESVWPSSTVPPTSSDLGRGFSVS